jgi:hypothetical protein
MLVLMDFGAGQFAAQDSSEDVAAVIGLGCVYGHGSSIGELIGMTSAWAQRA